MRSTSFSAIRSIQRWSVMSAALVGEASSTSSERPDACPPRDQQIVDGQHTAHDEHSDIDHERWPVRGIYGAKPRYEGRNEYEVIGQEAPERSAGVAPQGKPETVEEVCGRAKERAPDQCCGGR